MSTYAQIVRATANRCLAGEVTSVLGQAGDAARVVSYVADAWLQIQQLSDSWRWMRKLAQFNLRPGISRYPVSDIFDNPTAAVRRWHGASPAEHGPFVSGRPDRSDEQEIVLWDFDDFERLYDFGTKQPDQRPTVYAVGHDNALHFGPAPDANYKVRVWYQKAPQELVLDGDVPDMPAEYHKLIEYLAAANYAVSDNAPEIYTDSQNKFMSGLAALKRSQLDQIRFDGPLA